MANDEKKYNEKDAVLRERAAFVRGSVLHRNAGCPRGEIESVAKGYYPLPKITRLRVAKVTLTAGIAFRFRWRNGRLEWANIGTEDWSGYGWIGECDAEILIPVAADLLANPTETVEEDA